MTEQATNNAVETTTPPTFTRKIGKTLYLVNVSFNEKSNESMQDKVERLIKSEILKSQQ